MPCPAGRNLFPATAYLALVWETLALVMGNMVGDLTVCFENVKFVRATHIQKDLKNEFTVMMQRGSGRFEVTKMQCQLFSVSKTFYWS